MNRSEIEAWGNDRETSEHVALAIHKLYPDEVNRVYRDPTLPEHEAVLAEATLLMSEEYTALGTPNNDIPYNQLYWGSRPATSWSTANEWAESCILAHRLVDPNYEFKAQFNG